MRTHATNSCYASGCRIPVCRRAHADYERKRRNGGAGYVSATPFREMLRELTLPSVHVSEIAAATGLSPETLFEIRRGNVGVVNSRTAEKLEDWMAS